MSLGKKKPHWILVHIITLSLSLSLIEMSILVYCIRSIHLSLDSKIQNICKYINPM